MTATKRSFPSNTSSSSLFTSMVISDTRLTPRDRSHHLILLVPSHGLFVSRRPERQVPTTSRFQCLADAAAGGLDGLRKVMALRLGRPAPVVPLDTAARFVVIESA